MADVEGSTSAPLGEGLASVGPRERATSVEELLGVEPLAVGMYAERERRRRIEEAREAAEIDMLAARLAIMCAQDPESTARFEARIAASVEEGYDGTPEDILTTAERALFLDSRELVVDILKLARQHARQEAAPKIYGGGLD